MSGPLGGPPIMPPPGQNIPPPTGYNPGGGMPPAYNPYPSAD